MPPRNRWPDPTRLLQRRKALVQDLSDPELSCSLQAFLAWRAFLVVARGRFSAGTESAQCQQLMMAVLAQYPMEPEVRGFLRGLVALTRQSNVVMQEWFGRPDQSTAQLEQEVASSRRRIAKLQEATLRSGPLPPGDAARLGDLVYAVRNAAIAHASVHTTGNVFLNVVGPFGDLLAAVTSGAIAQDSGVPVEAIAEEIRKYA